MPRSRWSPLMNETAREFHERALRYLLQDFEFDYAECRNQTGMAPGLGLFESYLERAVQLGRDVAEDIQAEGRILDTLAELDTPTPEAPTFTHDCETCLYLGSGTFNGQPVDFYRHPGSGPTGSWPRGTTTAIARTGNDGPDYASMPESMLATAQPLTSPLAEYRRRYLLPSA